MENARGLCARSGFDYPLKELVRQWDGHLVHPSHLDPRHPSDLIRAPRPERPLPYSAPEPTDVFLSPGDVTPADL